MASVGCLPPAAPWAPPLWRADVPAGRGRSRGRNPRPCSPRGKSAPEGDLSMFSIEMEERSSSHQNNVQLRGRTFNLLLQSGKMKLDWINEILRREILRSRRGHVSLQPSDMTIMSPLGCRLCYPPCDRAQIRSLAPICDTQLLDVPAGLLPTLVYSPTVTGRHVMLRQGPARVAIATGDAEATLGVVERQPMAKGRAGSRSSGTGESA